jgi:hypothetical protein
MNVICPRSIEILQIRRRLILARGHQRAIRAQEVVVLAEYDLCVVLAAIILGPVRTRIRIEDVSFVYGPRPRKGVVNYGDFIMKHIGIDLVAANTLLEDGLIVEVQGQT